MLEMVLLKFLGQVLDVFRNWYPFLLRLHLQLLQQHHLLRLAVVKPQRYPQLVAVEIHTTGIPMQLQPTWLVQVLHGQRQLYMLRVLITLPLAQVQQMETYLHLLTVLQQDNMAQHKPK